MSYTHPLLSHAIDAHFQGRPPEGIGTADGCLTTWPGPIRPSDAELAQWVTEYQAKPEIEKNPRLSLDAELDGITTVAGLKAFLKKHVVR